MKEIETKTVFELYDENESEIVEACELINDCGGILNPEFMPNIHIKNWVSLESLKAEMIKQYHRSEGNKHKFIKEFFELSDEDIINGSERKNFLKKRK